MYAIHTRYTDRVVPQVIQILDGNDPILAILGHDTAMVIQMSDRDVRESEANMQKGSILDLHDDVLAIRGCEYPFIAFEGFVTLSNTPLEG